MTVAEAAIRRKVENLLYRCAELADAGDAGGIAALLTHATLDFAGTRHRAAPPARLRRGTPSRHLVTSVIVTVEGADAAATRCRNARGHHPVTHSWSA